MVERRRSRGRLRYSCRILRAWHFGEGGMGKGRLEAFSDGVIAVIITIMVLELKIPHGNDLAALASVLPVFLSYVLSFVYVGIYWNNHHHMLHAVQHVNGRALWANLHLLFWLSLIPFVTGWASETHFASLPVAIYGFVLLMAGVAYYILERVLIAHHVANSSLARAMGKDMKGVLSVVIYAIAIVLSQVNAWFSCALYVLVAIMWFIPDPRIERTIPAERGGQA
jgi:uncharacterized membrane protein